MTRTYLCPCSVDGCAERTSRTFLMCAFHWARVSRGTKRKVYATFRAYRDDPSSPEMYWAAKAAAIKEASA